MACMIVVKGSIRHDSSEEYHAETMASTPCCARRLLHQTSSRAVHPSSVNPSIQCQMFKMLLVLIENALIYVVQ